MRTLFAHPLRRLIPLLLLSLAVSVIGGAPLPRPIGQLSDYGNVLDRHGRERISSLIDDVRDRYAVDVYILASWENPLSDIAAYADAVFDYWELNRGKTILAVFLRTGGSWEVRIRGSDGIHAGHGRLEEGLETGLADLVSHRRIEEAMIALFDDLERTLGPSGGEIPSPSASHPLTIVGLVIAGAAGIGWLIHRRICPRCGRFLRTTVVLDQGRERRVYYCRRCGFRRYR